MGRQLDMFTENPNARVIMRQGSRIVIAVDGGREQRIIMDVAELPEQMAERMTPGTWLNVKNQRGGGRRIRILDEQTQTA